jgi:hypothetical protein
MWPPRTDLADPNDLPDATQQRVDGMMPRRQDRHGDLGHAVRIHHAQLRQLEFHLAEEVEDSSETVVGVTADETDLMLCSLHAARVLCFEHR